MFLQWSVFALNAFFLLLDLSVALSYDAALAHISRKTEGYAQCIRWIHQAGKWEMVTAAYLSRGMKAKAPLKALSMALLTSIALLATLTAAKFFAKEVVAERNPSHELVSSRQAVVGGLVTRLAGWTFPVPYDANMEEILSLGISNTNNIPRAASKRYRPRVAGYEVACERFDFKTPNRTFLVLPQDGCANITLTPSTFISGETDPSRMYTVGGSKGRIKVVVPARISPDVVPPLSNMMTDVGITTRVDYLGTMCLNSNFNPIFLNANYAGISSPPRMTLTKCLLATGESIILSTSVIRFTVPRNEMFHSVATSIFGEQDDLIKGMQDSVNNSTLVMLTADVLEALTIIEAKMTNTGVTALICVWTRQSITGVPRIACSYTIINTLIIKPQPMDPDIARRLINKGLNPSWSNVTTTMVLIHDARVSKNTAIFNIPKILSDSAAASRYIASLGNNFVLDWEASMLYIIFDTTEILKGYDIPRWLFFSMIGTMTICFSFWAATELLLDARCRDSLYVTVSRELTCGKDCTKPRLHRFDPKTLVFEGRRRLVVPASSPNASKDDSLYNNRTPDGSQDPLMAI